MFREDGCRNDLHTGWSLSRGRGARGGLEGTESRRGRSLQFCANSSSGRQGEARQRAFLGPRNRGGKKVITFFAGRSRLKTAGGVVIASEDGAAPGGCYRTSLPRGKTLLSPFISPPPPTPPSPCSPGQTEYHSARTTPGADPPGTTAQITGQPRESASVEETDGYASRTCRETSIPRPPTSLERSFLTNQYGFSQ